MGICTSAKKQKGGNDDDETTSSKKNVIKANVKGRENGNDDTNDSKMENNSHRDDNENNNNNNDNKRKEQDEHVKKQPPILEIMLKFIDKGEEKYKSSFSTFTPIRTIFIELAEKLNPYAEYDIIHSNGQSLRSSLDQRISQVFPNQKEAELNLLYLGLEIANDVRTEYEKQTTIIASPIFNNDNKTLTLALYNKFEQKVTHTLIKDNIISFSQVSSFCNAKNNLFISGGETSPGLYIDKFYCIGLFSNNNIEQLPQLNEARGWHSMLFIPNSYVFIVGGSTKAVEMYNIDKKTITIDSELNEERREPTLCCVNNSILYAFCGFIENDCHSNTIERCNLRHGIRKWSFVNYNTSDAAMFEQCYYIASYFSDNSIILFACCENKKPDEDMPANILFDFENEDNPFLETYNSDINIMESCPEKFFMPMANNKSLLFPLTSSIVKMYMIDENTQLSLKEYPDVLNGSH